MNISQLEYQIGGIGQSQCERILNRLMHSPNQWVPMPELVRVSGSYAIHSRIADLRRYGWNIPPAKVERAKDGSHHSSYMLVRQEPEISPAAPAADTTTTPIDRP